MKNVYSTPHAHLVCLSTLDVIQASTTAIEMEEIDLHFSGDGTGSVQFNDING